MNSVAVKHSSKRWDQSQQWTSLVYTVSPAHCHILIQSDDLTYDKIAGEAYRTE